MIVLASCTANTVRPSYRPFPLSAHDTVPALPPAVIDAARQAVTALGLDVATVTVEEGYLETRWYRPSTRESRTANNDPAGVVRLRVWADLVTPAQTEMIVETVYRRAIDPSLPDRLNEHIAATGSAGDSLTQQLREAIRRQLGAGTP